MKKIAIISDIHGNYPALEAVLADIEKEGAEKIICLGDLVGYHCMINEVVDTIRELKIASILGNHDYALAYDPDYVARSRTAFKIINLQREYIKPENLAFLRSSPRNLAFDFCGKAFFCVHGGLEDHTDQYLFEVDEEYFEKNNFTADVLVAGHTHHPRNVSVGKYHFLNPGSVGQPRDGDPRASYLLLSGDGYRHRRVAYDIDRIANKMKSEGYEAYIYENLYHGLLMGQKRVSPTSNS